MAIKFGHKQMAEMLLKDKVFPDYKNSRDDRGYTPLHIACFRGDSFMTQLLLNHKVEVDIRGYDGKTPSDMCIGNAHSEV